MFDSDQLQAAGLLPGVPWSEFEPSGLVTDLLCSLDLDGVDADDALEAAAAWERLIAHAQAQQFRALARFAAVREGTVLAEFAEDEVAPVLHLSRTAAAGRVDLATRLCTALPDTMTALASGTIDLPRARAISEATEVLDDEATATVQARVLPKAPQQTVGELRAALSRAVLAADPDATARRHRAARDDRRVQLHPQPDGMGSLWAMLPADDATAAYARLDALARDLPADDPRGMDARRADVLTDLLLGRDVHAESPTIEAHVTLDAVTLAGLADHPGELAGYGPIPAEMARELTAAARRWRAALADEQTGQFKELSVAYRPSPELRRYIEIRDRTCCFPGCRQPARRCDLDHTIPYDQGGPTAAGNLGPLCRHHHRLKTHTSWSLCQPEPGLFLWTSPTGRVHHFRAPPPPNSTSTSTPTPNPHPSEQGSVRKRGCSALPGSTGRDLQWHIARADVHPRGGPGDQLPHEPGSSGRSFF
ncbi:MAG: DUF222 domain-containing protein [Pseudonocardiaceae bacterium]